MFCEKIAEEFFIHKIGVAFIHQDVVRVTLFDELAQSIVAVKGQEPGVFVPANE